MARDGLGRRKKPTSGIDIRKCQNCACPVIATKVLNADGVWKDTVNVEARTYHVGDYKLESYHVRHTEENCRYYTSIEKYQKKKDESMKGKSKSKRWNS